MSISIIGTGNVGSALAHVFARNKVEALVANTRGPASFRELAADVSPTVRGVELSEALASDLILLAIPFLAVESLGRSRRDWSGKTIVDVTNAFMLPNADEVLPDACPLRLLPTRSRVPKPSKLLTSYRYTYWHVIALARGVSRWCLCRAIPLARAQGSRSWPNDLGFQQ